MPILGEMGFAGSSDRGTFGGTLFCVALKTCRISPKNAFIRLLLVLWSCMGDYGRAGRAKGMRSVAHQNYTPAPAPALLVFRNTERLRGCQDLIPVAQIRPPLSPSPTQRPIIPQSPMEGRGCRGSQSIFLSCFNSINHQLPFPTPAKTYKVFKRFETVSLVLETILSGTIPKLTQKARTKPHISKFSTIR